MISCPCINDISQSKPVVLRGLNEKAFPHLHHRDLYDGRVWDSAGRYTHAGLTTRPVDSALRR